MNVTVTNSQITIAEKYNDIFIDILIKSFKLNSFLLKNVWYVFKLNCNLLFISQLLNQNITTVFIIYDEILTKKEKIIAEINIKDQKFWLYIINNIFIVYRDILIISNHITSLKTTEKLLLMKT